MKFQVQIGNLELRSCNTLLLQDEPHTTAEILIVITQENGCEDRVLAAYWWKCKRKYKIQLFPERMLETDHSVFCELMHIGQELLKQMKE